jgi:hypothetical protein
VNKNSTKGAGGDLQRSTCFYCDEAGENYALLTLESPDDVSVQPPAKLTGTMRDATLHYCGEPQGIVTRLNYTYRQVDIAKVFGTNQQTVSRWVSEYAPMHLSHDGWLILARAVRTGLLPVNQVWLHHRKSAAGRSPSSVRFGVSQ